MAHTLCLHGYIFIYGMKKIKLTQSKFAIVDDEDFEYLNQFKWFAFNSRGIYYACRGKNKKNIFMHREIMKTVKDMVVDHKNHNGLDCRKSNMRNCTKTENMRNRKSSKNSSSKYLGVSWCKARKKWQAHIFINKKSKNLGRFIKEIEAAKRYNKFAKIIHGDFANINQI